MGETTTVLGTVLSVTSDLFGVMTSVVNTVKTEPLLLIGVAGAVGSVAIAWFKSLTNQRRRGRR